jgi:hypothetical protein
MLEKEYAPDGASLIKIRLARSGFQGNRLGADEIP